MDEHKAAKALALIEQHGAIILNGLKAHYAEYGANEKGKAAIQALRELVDPEKVTITYIQDAGKFSPAVVPGSGVVSTSEIKQDWLRVLGAFRKMNDAPILPSALDQHDTRDV
jgi:hypothetical protein